MQETIGKVLLIDGTQVPVRRSVDSEQRKRSYSGKKEQFTFNKDNNKHQRNHNISNQ